MIDIILVDDHQHLRSYIRKTLERRGDVRIIAEAADGEEAICHLDQLRADLLLLDIEMPRLNGIEVLRHMKQHGTDIKTLVLSGYSDRELIQGALDLGAQGYLLKDEAYGHLFEAIDAVYRTDNVWLSEQAASALQ